ncbi:MAG: 2-carboxy-1,4-naphthoquinone phytyltransferase [Cyanobacteria bacterium P01_A01_bin.105]
MTIQTVSAAPSRSQLWMAAVKPPMYSVAVMPIWVGSLMAYAHTGQFRGDVFVTFVLSALLLLVWENLANDVFDAETGIDKNKAHSVVNLTQRPRLIFWLGNLALALGIAGIVTLAYRQRDPMVLGLILLCCLIGYLYQGPPFRLGYQGWGEPLCFVAFSVGVAAAYYSQAQRLPGAVWVAAALAGLPVTLVLFCSHFHQVEDDLAAGKRSPIVRLGTEGGARLLWWLCGAMFAIALLGILGQALPVTGLLVFASFPLAWQLCRHVSQTHDQPDQVKNAKFVAIRFQFVSGLLLGLSFWVTRFDVPLGGLLGG